MIQIFCFLEVCTSIHWQGPSGYNIHFMCSKTEKKRKRPISNLPDGSGLGDHIQLLQIFERWHQTDYDIGWCKDHGLQVPTCILEFL